MNLVVDDKDIVASADFHHLFQLFPAPNLAHRVMGVAEEQNLGVWAGSQLLQLLILDAVPAVFPLFQRQGVIEQIPPASGHRHIKGIINRGHDDDAVPRLAGRFHQHSQGIDHAGGCDNLLRANAIIVPPGHPAAHRVVIVLGGPGIPQDGGIDQVFQLLYNSGSNGKLHVRRRQRHSLHAGSGRPRPLAGAALAAVWNGRKIVLHNNQPSFEMF